MVAFACAFCLALAASSRGNAATDHGLSLTGAATELGGITGAPIEIHATPLLSANPALPLICKTLTEAFQEAAADPETKERLGRIVHVVVIQGWFAGGESHHVKLKDEVLTIETLTDRGDIEDLRPLIVEVLKKVAQLDAKRAK
jgi:hypothetical protein